jgi:glycosyltransferase involved in cell wall biosynthesis
MVADLAAGLAGRGHIVTLYCAEGSNVPGVRLRAVPVPKGAGRALVMPGGGQPEPMPDVREAFERIFTMVRSDGADAVSSHAFDSEALELAVGLPVLHTLHLPPIVDAVASAARKLSRGSLATVSESCRRDWQSAGVQVGTILLNGVPDHGHAAGQVEPVALMAGRLSREKGFEDGLAAAAQAGLRPVIVGAEYDRGYSPSLKGAELLGPLPRDELSELMARAAVVLTPIRWNEPFGLVAAEAQMAGCPVVAYDRGAMREVIEDGVSGYLVEPDSVHELALGIRRAVALDRGAVRNSALRRLGLQPMLDRYEAALEAMS